MRVILVRHGEVDRRYRGICYGQSDIGLSRDGWDQTRRVVQQLSRLRITRVVHSGLRRTRVLAELLADELQMEATCCEALRERHFGTWELKPWEEIYAQDGDEMMRMISEPEGYRPGGGETTYELRDRVLEWYARLEPSGLVAAVTHGGPIAALLGSRRRLPVEAWASLVPAYGSYLQPSTDPASVGATTES